MGHPLGQPENPRRSQAQHDQHASAFRNPHRRQRLRNVVHRRPIGARRQPGCNGIRNWDQGNLLPGHGRDVVESPHGFPARSARPVPALSHHSGLDGGQYPGQKGHSDQARFPKNAASKRLHGWGVRGLSPSVARRFTLREDSWDFPGLSSHRTTGMNSAGLDVQRTRSRMGRLVWESQVITSS